MKQIDKNLKIEFQKIQNQYQAQNFNIVISKCKKLIKEYGDYSELYFLIGSSYQFLNDKINAIKYFKIILNADPGNAAALNNLGNIYKNENKYEEAEKYYLKIIERNPNYINAYVNYGNLKRDLNNFEKSIELYKTALNINKKIPLIHYNLALAYQGLGNFELTLYHSNITLSLNNKFTNADLLKSACIKYTSDEPHIKEMCLKLQNIKLNDIQKSQLYFALGKAYEDIKDFKKSFYHLEIGNRIYRDKIKYSFKNDKKEINDLKEQFKDADFDKFKIKTFDKNLIFILGMPRSGTTLAEQIISTDPYIYGAGELSALSQIIKDNFMVNNALISESNFSKIKTDKLTEIANEYFENIKNFDINENTIVDKAPLNFRWIGFIKILFPNAKIIHCTRNPKDNCLSIYKNFFAGGLNWSYDQKQLGEYYNLYVGLMKFWKQKIPNFIYDLNYENLINNPEPEVKKLLNFCEIEWNKKFLSHHKNKTPIKTASVTQARQPIYKSSINTSDNFSEYLKILFKTIDKKLN